MQKWNLYRLLVGCCMLMVLASCAEDPGASTPQNDPDSPDLEEPDAQSSSPDDAESEPQSTSKDTVASDASEAHEDVFLSSDSTSPGDTEEIEEKDVPALTEDGGIGGSNIYPPQEIPDLLGGERPAKVFVPQDYTEEEKWPLVLHLHGYGGSSEQIDSYFLLSGHVSSKGFILITPDGTVDEEGKQFWNSPDCCNKYSSAVNDVAYLEGLIEEAKETLSVDASRIYVIGFSNGGFMAHYLACVLSETVAGIASLAGVTPKNPSVCFPSSSVGVLQIHGSLDASVPYDGTFYFSSAEESTQRWVEQNDCETEATLDETNANYDFFVPGDETVKTQWSTCSSENEVALWTLETSGHGPYLHPDFTPEVLDWLFGQVNPLSEQ